MSLADPLLWISAALAFAVAWLAVALRRERAALARTAGALATSASKLIADASCATGTHADAVEHVRRTTHTMTQLTHGAMTTVVSAETVVGLALQSARARDDASAERMRRLEEALRDAARTAGQITEIAQQQSGRFDEVLRAMNEIYLATERSLAATERVVGEARALDELATRLRRAAR